MLLFQWDLFKPALITSAAASCGCKCVEGQTDSVKRTAWWKQEVFLQRKLDLELG